MARKPTDDGDTLAIALADLGVIADLLDDHDAATNPDVIDWLIVQASKHIRTARAAHAHLRAVPVGVAATH